MRDAVLTTRRLELRPCSAADRDELHAQWTDEDVRRWLWDDEVIAKERADEVIEQSERNFAAHGFGVWVARARADGAPVGFVGLRFVDETEDVELLYGLWPSRWGQGLATEAASAVLGYGFEALGLARIMGRVDTPNGASVRVLERLGMQAQGESFVDGRPTAHFLLDRDAFLRPGGA